MSRHWYMRGICKTAGLRKQADYTDPGFNTRWAPARRFFYNFMPAGDVDPSTGLNREQWNLLYDLQNGRISGYNPIGFKFSPEQMSAQLADTRYMNYVNQDIDQSISKFKKDPDLQQRAAIREQLQKETGNMPHIPTMDTLEARKARSESIAGTIEKLKQYRDSNRLTPAQRDEVQLSINLWQKKLDTNNTTAYRAIGPDGRTTWQSNLKAPLVGKKQLPTYTRTTTGDQHTSALAEGKGVIMSGNDVGNVRKGYLAELDRIAKAKAGDNNALINVSGGALSPTRKVMDPDSYLLAKETHNTLALLAQEAQIRENMKRLGRSRAQVLQARRDGSDARAQKSYALLTQKANAFINPKKQNTPTTTAPTTTQSTAAATPGNTKTQPQVAQPAARPATTTTQPQPPARPKPIRGMPAGTYDTTTATGGRKSYTRNGITYLQYDNAADAQNALGTNNVMAMTRGGKRYWAPINAKSTSSVGGYAKPQTNKRTKYKVRTMGGYQ